MENEHVQASPFACNMNAIPLEERGLTGREGVKPFILAEIGQAFDDRVARGAGF